MTLIAMIVVFTGCIIGLAVAVIILSFELKNHCRWMDNASIWMDHSEDETELMKYRIQCLYERSEKKRAIDQQKAI